METQESKKRNLMKLTSRVICEFFKSIWTFLYDNEEPHLDPIDNKEYFNIFIKGRKREEIESSYQKAWEAKNFEIENYWKRTNYFWAFQVASFAGYFAILGSDAYSESPQVLFFIICIGLVTSFAWTFINRGSKTWQRHWEAHVDMLEDNITGPLYKTVTAQKTFSVSKINEIVSRFIIAIWMVNGLKYFLDHITFRWSSWREIDFLVVISIILTAYFIGAMYFGYGRGRFGYKKVDFYGRKSHIEELNDN